MYMKFIYTYIFLHNKLCIIISIYILRCCAYCLKSAKGGGTCAGCKKFNYCSITWQRKDWGLRHKCECIRICEESKEEGTKPLGEMLGMMKGSAEDAPLFPDLTDNELRQILLPIDANTKQSCLKDYCSSIDRNLLMYGCGICVSGVPYTTNYATIH